MTEDGQRQPPVETGKRAWLPSATQRWRAESNAYRAVYLERTGKPLPSAAVPLPRPAQRALSLLLLMVAAFFFVLCAAVSLVVLQPNSAPPASVQQHATPIFHVTATTGNSIILPGVTFTSQTPAIVEPVGGGQGVPYVTPTATGGVAATATPTGTPGIFGTPGAGGGGPPLPPGLP